MTNAAPAADSIAQIRGLMDGGDLAAAERACTESLQRHEADALVHLLHGYILWRLGRPSDAASHSQRAIDLGLKDFSNYQFLGSSLKELGRSQEACEAFAQAHRLHPAGVDAAILYLQETRALYGFERAKALNAQLSPRVSDPAYDAAWARIDSEETFVRALSAELAASRDNAFTDNYDRLQQGEEPPFKPVAAWRRCLSEWAASLRRMMNYYLDPQAYFRDTAVSHKDLHFVHSLVADQASRDLVVKLMAYRVLGHRKVKLPRNTPAYWEAQQLPFGLITQDEPIETGWGGVSLALYDCKPLGYDIRAYASTTGVACTLVQKQYELRAGNRVCKAEDGDVVLDAGACWGDTTLYFAHEVGPQGKVIAFEFIPSNLRVLKANLGVNPALDERVSIVEQALWSTSGRQLYYVDWGPGSRVSAKEDQYRYDGVTHTITIDEAVHQQGLARVDFIKMDIEGAELHALHGAEATIRAHQPKLAISLYHQLSDFTTIPRYLDGLGLAYDFFLDHHTLYENETVLFAIPRDRQRA